jgi:hypothetical protein
VHGAIERHPERAVEPSKGNGEEREKRRSAFDSLRLGELHRRESVSHRRRALEAFPGLIRSLCGGHHGALSMLVVSSCDWNSGALRAPRGGGE